MFVGLEKMILFSRTWESKLWSKQRTLWIILDMASATVKRFISFRKRCNKPLFTMSGSNSGGSNKILGQQLMKIPFNMEFQHIYKSKHIIASVWPRILLWPGYCYNFSRILYFSPTLSFFFLSIASLWLISFSCDIIFWLIFVYYTLFNAAHL